MLTIKVMDANEDKNPVIDGTIKSDWICALISFIITLNADFSVADC